MNSGYPTSSNPPGGQSRAAAGGFGPPMPIVGPPPPRGGGGMAAGPPQGSKLATYMKGGSYGGAAAPPAGTAAPSGLDSRLRELSISGIREFVPSGGAADANGAAADPTLASSAAAAAAAAAINSFNDGGTMYFYQGDGVMDPTMANGGGSGAMVAPSSVMSANYTVFQGTPSFVADLRTQSNLPNTASESEIKSEILRRQSICLTQADPESNPGLPTETDGFTNFVPLEPPPPTPMHKSHTFGYVTSVYKATSTASSGAKSSADGPGGSTPSYVCVRRVQNFRLTNSKCMVLVEQWKKLQHTNLVSLRQVFTSKAFGDQSMLFIYDFFPGAETLMAKHFTQGPPFFDQFGFPTADFASTKVNKFGMTSKMGGPGSSFHPAGGVGGPGGMGMHNNGSSGGGGGSGLLPETMIWTYVVQLASALRHIHTAGLACRTLDPTKILVINKTRLLLNCCGMFDVLTFDPTASNPMAAMAHYQQEDLIALGKIVLALACNSFLAIQRENLQSSMGLVTTNYSSDMRNLIMYLLTDPNRVKSVNDLMPMVGARFYVALDEAHQRIDLMEAELARDVESARLFRLLTKLSTVVDRAELNGDESWSEYGDRYMLKLFRDYVFHQVMEDGRPWLDMAHVVACLNKFDAGVSDKVCLMSRDEQNVLVVSYAELKECLVQSYAECMQSAKHAGSAQAHSSYHHHQHHHHHHPPNY